jgi:hypothetical protein
MNIKVAKEKLVAAITAKRAEVIAEHAAAVKAHAVEFADFKRKMTIELSNLLTNVKSAKKIDDITKRLKYGTRLEFDKIPEIADAPNTAKYDQALAQLALSSDEIIVLSDHSDRSYLALIS